VATGPNEASQPSSLSLPAMEASKLSGRALLMDSYSYLRHR
jgi:hypothetical protein